MISVQTNMLAMNANRQYKACTGAKEKTTRKLSSGYRINRAADDAAGLAISEKMRRQIRGLMQGTENGENGISWVQVGDGSLEEAHDMLHRMTELSVKSLNETNTEEDRAYMQMEFEQLQTELDRLTHGTTFNDKQIFNEHESPYYQYEGNIKWGKAQKHVIQQPNNDLTVLIQRRADWPLEEATITVPSGVYTTQELMDEIDDAFEQAGLLDAGVYMEYTQNGTCNLNLEGGLNIASVGGHLSYLLYDTFEGGSLGALIGTTIFKNESAMLRIADANNHMSFTIENISGVVTQKELTLDNGYYTRQQLIDKLNDKLSDTSVRAMAYGESIKLASDDSIITGFKGNMFKIDRPDRGEEILTSVFYDNIQQGNIIMQSAVFTGGAVLPTESRDEEHKYYVIDNTNNLLKLQPNSAATSTTLTIPDGKYTAAGMAARLNQLFADNALELQASVTSEYVSGKSYEGIRITSKIKGALSKVGVLADSTAYETLFVRKAYNGYVDDASKDREYTANRTASFTGSKVLSAGNVPLTITTGQNDQFKLQLGENGSTSAYTITIPAGDYISAGAVADAINARLSGPDAALGYKGKVEAVVSSNKIMLRETAGSNLTSVTAAKEGTNKGYNDIFIGVNVSYISDPVSSNGTSTAPASVTLKETIPEPVEVNASNNKLKVNVDGVEREVTLPIGSNSHADIVNSINDQLKSVTTTSPNTFQDVNATGTATTKYFTKTGVGEEYTATRNYSVKGTADLPQQGVAESFKNSVPARVTLDKTLAESTIIDAHNRNFTISINGTKRTIALQEGTYSRTQFAGMLQNKLDEAYGAYYGGAKVSLENNCLKFEARLTNAGGVEYPGSSSELKISTSDGGFVKDLYTTYKPATVTSQYQLDSTVVIDSTNNKLDFRLKENGTYRDVSVTIADGSYSRNGLITAINNALTADSIAVKASLSADNKLVLTTDGKGLENGLVYEVNETKGGSSAAVLYGPLKTEYAASAVAGQTMQEPITIGADSDSFSVTVNGVKQTVTLTHGTYATRDAFIQELNTQFQNNGIGLKATSEGNKIRYTTESKGSSASFSVTYAGGGSAMKAIYGETTTTRPGVVAEFTGDNKLKLTRTANGGSLRVDSSTNGLFQKNKKVESTISPTSTTGYHSTKKSYVDGVNITEPVVIDQYKNSMSFHYYEEGVSNTTISFTVPEKSYTFAELQTELQNILDTKVGAGKIVATVSGSGVRFEASIAGTKQYMQQYSGSFYDHVFCSTKEKVVAKSPVNRDGNQTNESIFAVGRKDIRNHPVDIKRGTNDELSIDFTYGGSTTTLKITLDPAKYNSEGLKQEIQKKLDVELEKKGLAKGLIEVGVGDVSTGVAGANDANALNFKLSNKVQLPGEGKYIIDGVSGNAAFSVFYQTDGEIANAYVAGNKDISKGVDILPGQGGFGFRVDQTDYQVNIPAGHYTATEMVEKLNDIFKNANVPVTAEYDVPGLRLNHAKYGQHRITNIVGPAKKQLFFEEKGGFPEDEVNIRLSSENGDYVSLNKPYLSTVAMGINSINIGKPKYAEKALRRLKDAVEVVSGIRSEFGAKQNHLEHAIANNENKTENSQAAESRIRDADIAIEMVHQSIHNVMEQANVSMLSQANQNNQLALRLLKG